MTAPVLALIVAAGVLGLYWWKRTPRQRPNEWRMARRRKRYEETLRGFRDLLMSLRQAEELPAYPPQCEGERSGLVTFYTIVRGDVSKVAAAISRKSSSYEETSGGYRDEDAIGAASAIGEMLNARTDRCSFRWGTNTVEYRLHRDRSDEFIFVEIMKRPR